MQIQLTRFEKVDSTAVASLRFNYALQRLTVEFENGNVYEYLDVPPDVYRQVSTASSVGKAFNALIKHNYEFVKTLSKSTHGT